MFKIIVQQQKLVLMAQESPKSARGTEIRITKVAPRKSSDEKKELASSDNTEASTSIMEQIR